jgi:hypothetical protein
MKNLLVASATAVAAAFLIVGGPVAAQSAADICQAAKADIDYIVYANMSYRSTFDQAMRDGAKPYDALLWTERTQPESMAQIQACSTFAKDYLKDLGFGPTN